MPINVKVTRIFRLPYLPIVIAPFVLFSSLLFTGKALFWGTPALQFVPWWTWAWDTLLAGHLPLWNPLVGMGAPLIANYQSALFYPPNWLYFLFYALGGISALAWSQAFVVALHLVWSGLGMATLTRRLGLGRLAQTVSGLAFGLSGYLVARAWFASLNAAVAWLPWVLLLAYDLIANSPGKNAQPGDWESQQNLRNLPSQTGTQSPRSTRRVKGDFTSIATLLKLGIVIGLQLLAGHAQTSWYTWLLAALWVGFWAWRNEARGQDQKKLLSCSKSVIRAELLLALTIALGAAVAAVQLLPTAEYLLQSQRASAADYAVAMTYSFWPWRFLGLLAPNWFGNPAQGDYWGYANYWEDAIYVGLLPLLLALGAVLGGIFKPNRSTTDRRQPTADSRPPTADHSPLPTVTNFLLILTAISFLLALGQNTPVFPWLYDHIPTFDMFRAPTRFSIWAMFALTLLAGIGIERWRRPVDRALYWARLTTAGALAVSLGAGLAWYFLRDLATDLRPTFIRATALAGLWGLGVGVLSLLAPPRDGNHGGSNKVWQWAVVSWVAADLLVAGWGLNPGISADFYRWQLPNLAQVREMTGDGRLYLLAEDEDQIKYKQYFVFDTFDPGVDWGNLRAMMLPNLNMLVHIPMVNNYDPLVPGRYAVWMDEIRGLNLRQREDLLDLMGIAALEWEARAGNFGVRFVPRGAAARVRWVPCARIAEDGESALKLALSGLVDFGAEVILENTSPSQNRDCTSLIGSASILSEHPNRILIQVTSSSPGWVVLSDVWYPGWQAQVDGNRVPVLRADYLFRAVEVPAGAHEIVLAYRPVWFYVGVGLSLLACLGLGAYFWAVKFHPWSSGKS